MVLLAPKARMGNLDPKVHKAQQVPLVPRGQQVKELEDHQVNLARKVPQDHEANPDFLDEPVVPAPRAPRAM